MRSYLILNKVSLMACLDKNLTHQSPRQEIRGYAVRRMDGYIAAQQRVVSVLHNTKLYTKLFVAVGFVLFSLLASTSPLF